MNPVHSLTIDVDVKSLLNVHMALIQNQPISTASAEDNNQRFSADNNNQDFPPSPLQGLLLPLGLGGSDLPVASVISSSC